MSNISVIKLLIWTSGSGEDVVYSHFSSGALVTHWFSGAEPVEDILGTIL